MAKKIEQVVPEIIDSVDGLNAKMNAMHEAQKIFATYTQEQVDKIFFAAASAADKMRLPLAKMAVEETGMGIVEDKVIKNNYAAEYIYNAYKDTKTVGVIEEDKEYGIKKIAEPIGLIAAVIPTTNPTSTAIFSVPVLMERGLDAIGCADWLRGLILDGIVAGVGACLLYTSHVGILLREVLRKHVC